MPGRSRIHIYGTSSSTFVRALVAIDHQFVVPFNCVVLQFCAQFQSLPTTPQPIEFLKKSKIGIGFEFIFRIFDPTIVGSLNYVCNEHFEVLKDETFWIRYPNTDELMIGYEAVLKEGD